MPLFLTDLTFIDENEDMVARRKKAPDAEDPTSEGAPSAEIAAKESHDEVKAKENEDPTATRAEASSTVENANAEQVAVEEPKELINFQKMELIGEFRPSPQCCV